MPAGWKMNLSILWAAQVIGMSAITGVISFLPLYVPHLGIADAARAAMWSGVLIAAAAFSAALSNPFWGAMADRKGRKPMVEKTLLLFGIIMVAMAYVTNVYQLLALRIVQGLCGGFSAAATALAVSMSPVGKISATVGIFQTALIVGGAVGPMIGGLIADCFGYRVPFVVFGALCFVTFVIIHFTVAENFTPVAKSEKGSLRETIRYVWSLGDLRLMLVVQFLAQFAIQSIGPILPLYIMSLMPDSTNLASISGLIIAVAGVTSAVSSASMGLLSSRFSHRQILIASSFLGGISFVGQLAAGDVATLAVLRAVNGLCIGAMIPSSNTIIAYLIPGSRRGAAFGLASGASLMGGVVGPISAGLMSLAFGISSIFWLTAGIFFFVAVLLFAQVKGSYAAQLEERAQA